MDKKVILSRQSHRPFPLPQLPWIMEQTWKDLLFAHWRFSPELLQPLIPAPFELDTYDGMGWLGITPFKMRNVKFRIFPPIPTATDFGEVNVRTYVRYKNRPGIFFFSLDASSLLAVLGARLGISLPYRNASIKTADAGDIHFFQSKRKGETAELAVEFQAISPVYRCEPGSLECWLTERYCFFEKIAGFPVEVDIHHLQWPLQKAEADFRKNTMTLPLGLKLPEEKPLLHYVSCLQVLIWPVHPAHGKH